MELDTYTSPSPCEISGPRPATDLSPHSFNTARGLHNPRSARTHNANTLFTFNPRATHPKDRLAPTCKNKHSTTLENNGRPGKIRVRTLNAPEFCRVGTRQGAHHESHDTRDLPVPVCGCINENAGTGYRNVSRLIHAFCGNGWLTG